MTHILIVDDDAKIRLLLRRCFEGEGYRVSEAASGAQAAQRLSVEEFDLVTLDLHLPDADGLTISRRIRAHSHLPIIIVTGKGDTVDKIVGLELGADDYVTKPFNLRELLARVRTVLRRSATTQAPTLAKIGKKSSFKFGDWIFDTGRRELRSKSGDLCDLTTSEFNLLAVFSAHPHHVLSRDQIMDLLRGHDWTPADRSIDNLVARLRRKIEPDSGRPALIKTVHGAGYCFAADVD